MKKVLEFLGKAKKYIALAVKYLGKLLGVVKSVEEQLGDDVKKEVDGKQK